MGADYRPLAAAASSHPDEAGPAPRRRGVFQVDADGDGSRLTLFLATSRGDAPDQEVMGTLDAIRRLVEAQV